MSDENDKSTPARKDGRIPRESLPAKFNLMDLLDPRSPTTAFQRTPIQVLLQNSKSIVGDKSSDEMTPKTASVSSTSYLSVSSPQKIHDESLELSASSASYFSLENLSDIESINLSSDDLSIVVSDLSSSQEEIPKQFLCDTNVECERREMPDFTSSNAEIEEPSSTVNDEVDRSIDERSIQPELIKKVEVDSTPDSTLMTPKKSLAEKLTSSNGANRDTPNDSLLENAILIKKKPLKNIFYTPNPHKKRNPLGTVDNTCPTTPPSHLYGSPQNVLAEKQWKRIQEERKKLGLEADENTQLPLYDITASAPSKLIRKPRLRARHNGVMS